MLPRPSNAGRWANCPASPRLESPFPDDESEDAREGTAAHWVAAEVLSGRFQLEELTDRSAPNGVIINGEMVEHVETYISAVHGIPVIEQMIPVAPGVEPGTPDARRVEDRTAYVWDFKYGYSIVEAAGNWQLACYAIAIMAKHEWNLDRVIATIVQPRPWHIDGRVRSWTITRDEAIALYHEIAARAARTADPNAPAISGEHCKHCTALHVCESARRAALNAIDVALTSPPIDMTGEPLAAELRSLRRAASAIALRLDAIEGHATALIDSGAIVPGFSVDRAMGRRRWVDPKQIAALEALTGLRLTTVIPLSPRQAEKAGAPEPLVKLFTTTPETGRKLIERDASAKAREVFK